MLELYSDQAEIMQDVRGAMKNFKSILLQSATGSGKTAMACDMVTKAARKNKRIVFSVPRRDLLIQTSKTFTRNGIGHSFIAAGREYNPFANVYIGMVDTMHSRIDRLPKDIDLFIPDECHYGAEALDGLHDHFQEQEKPCWTVGLTATPWKMNGKGMGRNYKTMVMGKSIRWLIDNKRLSDYKYFHGRTREDFHALQKRSDKANAEFMEERNVIIGDCVSDYRARCFGRLHIVRCSSIKHSQRTAEAFRNDGIPAMHVDGETEDFEKARIFKAFARREILVLTFADLLNFGFDLGQATGMDVTIESCSDLKISKSLAGQMQFWGRSLRYKDYPAIFNDHVNNWAEHGVPCDDRNWSLDSLQSDADDERRVPSKQCDKCYFVHSPAPRCPECGHVYIVTSSAGIKTVSGELHELDIEARRNKIISEEEFEIPMDNDIETLEMLIKQAAKEGKKNPAAWAAKELAKRINGVYSV